MQQI
jgi:Ras-related protein Rab-8A